MLYDMLSSVVLFAGSIIGIIWSIFFLTATIVGVSLNKVSGIKMKKFLSSVKIASVWTNGDPDQWIIGKYYIGYTNITVGSFGEESKTLYLLSTSAFYRTTVDGISPDATAPKTISFYEREGSFYNLHYTSRELEPTDLKPKQNQEAAIEAILEDYNKSGHSTVLLHGKAGSGKSMVPLFLAKKLLEVKQSVSLVDTFNPSEPSDTLANVYAKVNPSSSKPCIIVFEEIDQLICCMHDGKGIKPHKQFPIQIRNKTDWNMFMDRFDRKLYQNVILIMTSNKSLDFFNELDTSYFRDGRVNVKIEID